MCVSFEYLLALVYTKALVEKESVSSARTRSKTAGAMDILGLIYINDFLLFLIFVGIAFYW